MMQRVINDPDRLVEDMLPGFLKANEHLVHPAGQTGRCVVSNWASERLPGGTPRVGIVTGGGSGHWPAFVGYCGHGMCDAVAVGEIFSSPTAKAFGECIEQADQGRGVAVLYGNYVGDNMNVAMTARSARKAGHDVQTLVANDDVASAPIERTSERRGVAGEVLMWKCGGAKAAMGGSLDEVMATAQAAVSATRSVGIGLAPCTIPSNGKPNFHIEPGTMEVGIGHHGEPGVRVEPLPSARDMAGEMVGMVTPELSLAGGDQVAILISGLGATPVMEQYILAARVYEDLDAKGVKVHRSYVGNMFTLLEMVGVTLTLMKLDDELTACIGYHRLPGGDACLSAGLGGIMAEKIVVPDGGKVV